MTVTVASFRADLPEFANQSNYPTPVINYWLSMAALLMGTASGSPPKVASFTGGVVDNVLTVTEMEFGTISLFPLLLQGNQLPVNAAILLQIAGATGGIGTYKVNFSATDPIEPENMVALSNATFQVGNPFWGPSSIVPTSPPTTIADFATEMWTAHQIVLEKQALAAAATGGDPGTKIGIISSKSVNGVSVGFDISSITGGQEKAGYYNQTIYGMRFWRLMRLRGSGPIQLGIGRSPPFLFFNNWGLLGSNNAWAGPYPGIEQGDSGFSS